MKTSVNDVRVVSSSMMIGSVGPGLVIFFRVIFDRFSDCHEDPVTKLKRAHGSDVLACCQTGMDHDLVAEHAGHPHGRHR